MTLEEVKKLDIRTVVDDPEWQELRKSFLGTWKTTPGENVTKLYTYIEWGEDPLKVRRVLNYLTGTAFRTKRITHPSIDRLLNIVRQLYVG